MSVRLDRTVLSIRCTEQPNRVSQKLGMLQACYLSRGFKCYVDSQICIMHEETDKTQILLAQIHM